MSILYTFSTYHYQSESYNKRSFSIMNEIRNCKYDAIYSYMIVTAFIYFLLLFRNEKQKSDIQLMWSNVVYVFPYVCLPISLFLRFLRSYCLVVISSLILKETGSVEQYMRSAVSPETALHCRLLRTQLQCNWLLSFLTAFI